MLDPEQRPCSQCGMILTVREVVRHIPMDYHYELTAGEVQPVITRWRKQHEYSTHCPACRMLTKWETHDPPFEQNEENAQ